MKRQREDDGDVVCGAQATPAFTYQSPLRTGPPRALWAPSAAAMGHAQALQHQHHITPTKRQRDRTVPMDAMSRLMSAATSAARMKKRAQMTLTSLFGGASATALPLHAQTVAAERCCSVCPSSVAGGPSTNANANANMRAFVPVAQLQRCSHCERSMGPCCSRECDNCASAFCSNCSTINCDEQFDRVFCLSCHYDLSR